MSGDPRRWHRSGLRALLRWLRGQRAENDRHKAIRLPKVERAASLKGHLSLVAIVKNEASYLAEWLEFHRLVGFEHIYLYDNGSTDDTAAVVRRYAAGYVTLIPWANFDLEARVQYQAYAHALCNFGPFWRWMAFIDIDEFLFPLRADNLQSAISHYDDLPAIGVQWHMFGTSGHKRRPPGLVIENYTERAQVPSPAWDAKRLSKWKCVVDPTRVRAVSSVHAFTLEDEREGFYDENRRWTLKSQQAKSVSKVLRLNHYFTKSEEEFRAKMARGSAAQPASGKGSRPKNWVKDRAEHLSMKMVSDDTILRFIAPLRERMTRDVEEKRPRASVRQNEKK